MFKSLNKRISTPIAIIIIIVCTLIVGGIVVWQSLEVPKGGEEKITEIKPPGKKGKEERGGDVAILKLWMPGAEPDGIPTNTPTEVRFTVMVTGAFPESLQLEQIDKEGSLITAVGNLKDDGENDDLSANDGIYSGIFEIISEKEGKLYYRTTVEYGGWPYESEIYELTVTNFPVGPGPSDPDFLVVDPETGEKLYSNELIVSFKDEISDERIRQIVSVEGVSVIGTIPSIGVFQLQIAGDGTSEGVYTAVKAFQDYKEVEYAEPNYAAELDNE